MPGNNRIFLSVPHATGRDLANVQEAFATNWLSTVGPHLTALEQQVSQQLGLPCVAVSSGTAGLHLAVRLLGIGPGHEVVVPTLTFVASCNPLLYQGARPVFLDSDYRSWNLDPNLLADFLQSRARRNRLPKAVIAVHLFGQSADLNSLLDACQKYDVPLLEDAANALGATYRGKQVGTFGAAGVYSLGGNKIISATAGGLLVSPRQDWVDQARHWSTQARDPDPAGLNNYIHSEVGYNYRMSNVLAAIALGQWPALEQRVAQRRAVFERYREAFADLPGIEPQPEADYGSGLAQAPEPNLDPSRTPALAQSAAKDLHTRWLSCFLIDEAEFGAGAADLIRMLDEVNVEARPVWKPMHTQPLYRGYESFGRAVAEDLHQRGICLPSSSGLTTDEQSWVIDRVRAVHHRARRG